MYYHSLELDHWNVIQAGFTASRRGLAGQSCLMGRVNISGREASSSGLLESFFHFIEALREEIDLMFEITISFHLVVDKLY